MKLNALFLYVITSILTPQTKGFSIAPKSVIPKQSNERSLSDLKKEPFSNLTENIGKKVMASILGSFLLLSSHTSVPILLPGGQAVANDSRIVGEIAGSGLVFKVKMNLRRRSISFFFLTICLMSYHRCFKMNHPTIN